MAKYDYYDTISAEEAEELRRLIRKNKRASGIATLASLALPAAIGAVAAKDHAGKGAAGGVIGGTVGGFAGGAAGGIGGAALAGIPTAVISRNPEAALIAAALGGGVGAATGLGAGQLYGAYRGGKRFGTNKEKTKKASEATVEDVIFGSFQDEILKIAKHCTSAHRAVDAAAEPKKKAKPKIKKAAMKIQPVPGPSRIRMPGKAALMGAAGLAAGVPIGAVIGYKREQKRLSPQERAVVEQAMRQAYRQGNMAMYNRLKRQVKAQSQKNAAK